MPISSPCSTRASAPAKASRDRNGSSPWMFTMMSKRGELGSAGDFGDAVGAGLVRPDR